MPRLANSTPVFLFSREGPAHAYGLNGRSRCDLPLLGAKKTTLAAVHVYLDHVMCVKCWTVDELRWP